MPFELDDIIKKVQGLIAKADHPKTPPAEAEVCRVKAEALMLKYRIEESQTKVQGNGEVVPVFGEFFVSAEGEFKYAKRTLVGLIVEHFDCRAAMEYTMRDVDGVRMPAWAAVVCGYPSDVRFIEAMATAGMLAFSKFLEPKYDPELSEQLNAYIMRKAGMEGRRIAMAIYGRDDKHLRPKVRKMFAAEATARGEKPDELLGRGNNVATYRKSYADAFLSEVWSRLARMRATRSEGTGLVLAGRKERINEAFYDRYPHLRPQPRTQAPPIGESHGTCRKCAKAKSGYCRDHSYLRPRRLREERVSYAGMRAGQAAARSLDLGDQQQKGIGQ